MTTPDPTPAELAALESQATPPPWHISDGRADAAVMVHDAAPSEDEVRYGGRPIADFDVGQDERQNMVHAKYLAACRNLGVGSRLVAALEEVERLRGIIAKLPLDLTDHQRPVIKTVQWGAVDLHDYAIDSRRAYEERDEEIKRLRAALIELRCWAKRGGTPEQHGAKCDTLSDALAMVAVALGEETPGDKQ